MRKRFGRLALTAWLLGVAGCAADFERVPMERDLFLQLLLEFRERWSSNSTPAAVDPYIWIGVEVTSDDPGEWRDLYDTAAVAWRSEMILELGLDTAALPRRVGGPCPDGLVLGLSGPSRVPPSDVWEIGYSYCGGDAFRVLAHKVDDTRWAFFDWRPTLVVN